MLALTILALAAAVFWTLWALRRHVQRRLVTEQALREEHAFRKAMEDSLVTGMSAVDLDGRIVYVNPAFCKMVGYGERELIGQAVPPPYWPVEDRERIEVALRRGRVPGAPRVGMEFEFERRGRERFEVLVYEAPLVDAAGRQTGWMGLVLDITERKRARERLRQQQERLAATARLVAMGEMASAMAHELNQPLSAISSYATGCLNVLEAGATPNLLKDALTKTSQQAQRAGRIIRRMYALARKSEPSRTTVHINAVVTEVMSLADAEAHKQRVRLAAQLATDDPDLVADPILLQQVLLNLVRNGMDAMADTPLDLREIVITTHREGGMVTVSVGDHGCGLSPEVQANLFEPFFTTKPDGLGMGLNVCRSILEAHRGRVWAEPRSGGGTVFSFALPVELA